MSSSAISAEDDRQIFIATCCVLSTTTLLVYEYLITFDREYQFIWKRRFSASTLVFLLARYSLLLEIIFDLQTLYPLTTTSCSALVWLTTALDLLLLFVSSTFGSLRAYALSGRQWKIASLVFILSLIPFGIILFDDVRQRTIVAPPPINCTTAYLVSAKLTNLLGYVERAATIAADVLVLAVTVRHTYRTRLTAEEASLQTPLHSLVLRDGALYFVTLLIINIADIVAVYLGQTFDTFSYIGEFIEPITTILILRFMLNLREIDPSQHGTEDSSHSSSVHSIHFATFVEPLGAPLDHDFSFSATDPNSLDEHGADRKSEDEDVLSNDEEIASGQANTGGLSGVGQRPSSVVEEDRVAVSA